MKPYLQMLLDETRRPLEVLKLTLVFSFRFFALLFLSLVLWLVFFLLPVIVLLSLTFHTMTNEAKRLLTNKATSSNLPAVSPLQDRGISHNSLNLQTINEDVRFWLRELERLKS